MKRITFLLTVIIAFWWLYKTSDKKGLKRFTQSIKISFIFAAAILGMPPTSSAEEMGNPGLITPIEKVQNSAVQRGGFQVGPVDAKNVLHIVDLAYVPFTEKQIVKNFCLKGACSPEGIVFIN